MKKVIRNILKIIEFRNIKLSIWVHGVGVKNNDSDYNIDNNINIFIILITLCGVFPFVYMKGICFSGI